MPMRVPFTLLLLSLCLLGLTATIFADESTTTQDQSSVESAPITTLQERKHILYDGLYGNVSISADKLSLSGNPELREVDAQGNVIIHMSTPTVTGTPLALTFNAASMQMGTLPPPELGKRKISGQIATIRNAVVTTCSKPIDHHHYDLRSKLFIIYPDQSFEARKVSLELAGNRLFTIPKLRGSLTSDEEKVNKPNFVMGTSSIDGTYVGINMETSLSNLDSLEVNAKLGTNELVRGGLFISRPVGTFNELGQGTLTLAATWREDVANRLISTDEFADSRLDHLTISRLPALQYGATPIPLFGHGDQAYSLRLGGGMGRYREDPTHLTENRAQAWGIISTPRYDVGPIRFHGEVGIRQALYSGGDAHTAYVTQLAAETKPDSDIYACAAFLRRRESGTTPFLFDRVLIPDELYTEVEVPIGKRSPFRLNISNRQDLSQGKSQALTITAIYSLDCLSYGLTYDPANKGFGFGMVINGFGSFRKGVGSIAFTQ